MDTATSEIKDIAEQLNTLAHTHAIGNLQIIRAELNGKRRTWKEIFSPQTIHEGWAFHHGGRSELQFNIGMEDISGISKLRYGVAFSFEPSRSLPSPDKALIPKVRIFNDYIDEHPEYFADMRMWSWQNEQRSSDSSPSRITDEMVKPGVFVFLGKRQRNDNINYETILDDFDRLLPLFEYVERGGIEKPIGTIVTDGFHFRAGFTKKSTATTATLAERELDINLRHNVLQAALCHRLASEYGTDKVGEEQVTPFGTKIDVVVRFLDGHLWYYEIKTALSPRTCIREALGQLMEYAYWPGACEAERLIICGENPLDSDGAAYLSQLKSRFTLPVHYEQIVL